jgi:hypothetical protein
MRIGYIPSHNEASDYARENIEYVSPIVESNLEVLEAQVTIQAFAVYQYYPGDNDHSPRSYLCYSIDGKPDIFLNRHSALEAAHDIRNLRDENLDHLGDQTDYGIIVHPVTLRLSRQF